MRALLYSPLFNLPAAGLVAALISWILLEPGFRDMQRVGGEVVLVNAEPFEYEGFGLDEQDATSLTVGSNEVVLFEGQTRLEPGADGQPPFEKISRIQAGAVIEAVGEATGTNTLAATAVRPATPERAALTGQDIETGISMSQLLLLPLTSVLVGMALLLAEGVSSRNWVRLIERVLIGALLITLFSFLAFIPAGMIFMLGSLVLSDLEFFTVADIPGPQFILFAAARSGAWIFAGVALGLGMNLARSTKAQLRNSVIGGALGGALGGVFFDPIDRMLTGGTFFHEAWASRLVGLCAVGVCVGLFVALVEHFAREAWIRVRTGPLAGKSFVLYKTPTRVGSAPRADIYLFKDAEIDAEHAVIHRVGNRYEIEDAGSRAGTVVGDRAVRRLRLNSGDRIVLGATVLEFEERAKQHRHS